MIFEEDIHFKRKDEKDLRDLRNLKDDFLLSFKSFLSFSSLDFDW